MTFRLIGMALTCFAVMTWTGTIRADGIVGTIVNAPLSATGTVEDLRGVINVYPQKPEAPGTKLIDPGGAGYGSPATTKALDGLKKHSDRDAIIAYARPLEE